MTESGRFVMTTEQIKNILNETIEWIKFEIRHRLILRGMSYNEILNALDSLSDEEIIAVGRKGDEEAYTSLIERLENRKGK